MKNYSFSIIIASYNGERYLKDCLASVFQTDYKNYELIMIEDGSKDNSLNIIEKFHRKFKFRLIRNERNLGLVINRNKAAKIAKGNILVFLDNDTKVDKNWLNALSQTFSKDKSVGAAQCKIFDFNKKEFIQQVGMKLIPYTGFGMTLGRGQKDNGQFNDPLEIISLGAALAVRKEVVKKVGGFDNALFHYTDDLDFSWRVWIAGYRIVLSPNAKIYHHIKMHNPNYKLYFHLTKNSLRMLIKNYELLNLIKFLPLSLLFNFIGGLQVLLRGSIMGIFGVTLGVIWSIFNLPDTLQARSKIEKIRRVKDSEIFNKIMISSNIFKISKSYFKNAKTTLTFLKEN